MNLKKFEQLLYACVLVLYVLLLFTYWGKMQGQDSFIFKESVKYVMENGVMPQLNYSDAAYHPPSFFYTAAFFGSILGRAKLGALLTSWLALLGTFLLLRKTLAFTQLLQKPFGVLFLYTTAAFPLYIFLAGEISPDPLTLFLGMLTLQLSVHFFWKEQKIPYKEWSFLILALAVGLLTKYSALLHFGIPFLVLFIRRAEHSNWKRIFRNICISCLIAGVLACPFYIARYGNTVQKSLPLAMSMKNGSRVQISRELRNMNWSKHFTQLFTLPKNISMNRKHPKLSSIPDALWYHSWKKRDYYALRGPRSEVQNRISIFYGNTAWIFVLLGTGFMFKPRKKHENDLSQFCWIIGCITVLYLCGLVVFATVYPIWKVEVVKAKYMAMGMLWIPLSIAYCLHVLHIKLPPSRAKDVLLFGLLSTFVFVNFLVPVY